MATELSRSRQPDESDEGMLPSRARGKSTLFAGSANLLNTIVGGGILGLPFAFRNCGLVVGIVYMGFFGFLSFYGIRLLVLSMRFSPVRSYEGLAYQALGRPGWVAYNVSTLINCYGACLSYIVAIGDILPPLMAEVGLPSDRRLLLSVVTCFLIFPTAVLRDISALQYVSGFAILIYSLFALVILSLAFESEGPAPEDRPVAFKLEAGGLIRAIPLCAFAFMCQTSLFPIIQELKDPSEPGVMRLSAAAVGAAASIYFVTGVGAYSHFGERLHGSLLRLDPKTSGLRRPHHQPRYPAIRQSSPDGDPPSQATS